VQLRLESPVAPVFGERFVIRSYSPQITIGGGVVLDSFAERHHRKAFAEDAQFLRRLLESSGDAKSLLFHIVRNAGSRGIAFDDIRFRTGWKEGALKNSIAANGGEIVGIENVFVTRPNFDSIKTNIIRRVAAFHKREPLAAGMSRESLKSSMSGNVVPPIFDAAIAKLVENRELKLTGDLIRSTAQETKLSDTEAKAKERLEGIYSNAKLEPPKLEEALVGERALSKDRTRRIFQLLIDDGTVTKVSEEFYFSSDAINGLRSKLSAFAGRTTGRTIDVAQFKDLAQVTRKYAIPLLEHFDREKVTVRSGDKRIIMK
jgi:selenocysteine-specific elongation factor